MTDSGRRCYIIEIPEDWNDADLEAFRRGMNKAIRIIVANNFTNRTLRVELGGMRRSIFGG